MFDYTLGRSRHHCIKSSSKHNESSTIGRKERKGKPTCRISKSFSNFGPNNINIMEESIQQIGQRLRGLRDVLGISAEEVAELCGITLEHYLKIEDGKADPGVYRLSKIAKRYGIDLNVLLFGEEPRMSSYFVTRKGQGLSVDRRKDYSYQSLASGFRGRKMDPYLVKVDPMPDGENHNKNSHEGQEFDMVVSGQLEITIGERVLTLNPGDSIYFDSNSQHCMRALGNEPCQFLCVII